MARKRDSRTLQRRIAHEAARIITDQRSGDLHHACRKAADALGVHDSRLYPSRAEIEAALGEQQRLFRGEAQQQALQRLRRLALEAMSQLADFRPRLVGPVADGSADSRSAIRLHLFAETPQQVLRQLHDAGIPWRETDHLCHFGKGPSHRLPGLHFQAGETTVELLILPAGQRSNPPLDPASHRPLQGLNYQQLQQLAALD